MSKQYLIMLQNISKKEKNRLVYYELCYKNSFFLSWRTTDTDQSLEGLLSSLESKKKLTLLEVKLSKYF
jgi:hypothetical protein